jgi:CspA family cold shock protein
LERASVKWFSNLNGYGFITTKSGHDLFVHHCIIQGDGYKALEEGQEVKFEIQTGSKGEQNTKVVKL